MSKIWVLLAASLLAGCSNMACQPQGGEYGAYFEAPAPKARHEASLPRVGGAITKAAFRYSADTARAQALPIGPDDTNPTGSAVPSFDTQTDGPKVKPATDLMTDPGLFSATLDRRPWPMTNSPEWVELQKDEARREKEISRVIKICRC